MPDILTLLLGTFALYILMYGVCWGTDKTDIEKYKKKIKLNKYTSILFFLWPRNEKVYWLIYIILIIESVAFILVWIAYLLNIVFLTENQMIISKNPQFTGISARQQLEFTTHLLLTD